MDLLYASEIRSQLYGPSHSDWEKEREEKIVQFFIQKYPHMGRPKYFFSSPSRTELLGNHTDHQGGKVLTATLTQDILAVALRQKEKKICLSIYEGASYQFALLDAHLDLNDEEKGTSLALFKGIFSFFLKQNSISSGLCISIHSQVPIGGGLSSSASLSMLIAYIANFFFHTQLNLIQLSHIAHYAEENYLDKPCGLMDYLACATGGVQKIDFQAFQTNVKVENISSSFLEKYRIFLIHTSSHSALSFEYRQIREEMQEVAQFFSQEYLAQCSLSQLLAHWEVLKEKINHRAINRAFHFLTEMERVEKAYRALLDKEESLYFTCVKGSAHSSELYLQNLYALSQYHKQDLILNLAFNEQWAKENKMTIYQRVHGGGFAGSIQVYIPDAYCEQYEDFLYSHYASSSIIPVSIRNIGILSFLLDR